MFMRIHNFMNTTEGMEQKWKFVSCFKYRKYLLYLRYSIHLCTYIYNLITLKYMYINLQLRNGIHTKSLLRIRVHILPSLIKMFYLPFRKIRKN